VDILFFMVPAAIIVAGIFVFAFIWATKQGQYDDLDTPAHKMLIEDEKIIDESITKQKRKMS
jgi:cbb3-type cytochrome oxidase maturation protein